MWRTALAAVAGLCASSAPAQGTPVEQAVKATYMVKFPAYVTWPQQRDAGRITVCVVGGGAMGGLIQRAAAGQRVGGRQMIIRRVPVLEPGTSCDIAFLGAGEARRASLAAAQTAPVVTVTDARFGPERGIIHFETVADRVRFHIDERAASRRGMAISSQLLSLALTVTPRDVP